MVTTSFALFVSFPKTFLFDLAARAIVYFISTKAGGLTEVCGMTFVFVRPAFTAKEVI